MTLPKISISLGDLLLAAIVGGLSLLFTDQPYFAAVATTLTLLIESLRSKRTEMAIAQAESKVKVLEDEVGVSAYKIDDAFIASLETAASHDSTPQAFYGFKEDVAWQGLLKGWLAPRSYDNELLAHVLRADATESQRPVAAIIGSGGSGKSASLRRLALTLHNNTASEVWWVDNPERLVQSGLPASPATETGAVKYLLIDEIQRLNSDDVRTLTQDVLSTATFKVIVAGRRLPGALQREDNQLQISIDSHPDLEAILRTIADKIPAWSAIAQELEAKTQSAPRLVHMLLVLARYANTQHLPERLNNLESIEQCFFEIIEDDIKQIKAVSEGLFLAVIDMARLKACDLSISNETLVKLIEANHPGLRTQQLLASEGADGWDCTRSLLFFSASGGVHFHHDELASAVIAVAKRHPLSQGVLINAKSEQTLLKHIMQRGRPYEASQALFALVRRHPEVAHSQEAVTMLDHMIKTGNPHPEYQQVVYNKALPLTEDQRISRIIKLSAHNPMVGGIHWVRRATHSRQERARLLQKLYDAGYRDDPFIAEYIRYSDPSRRIVVAEEMLQGKVVTDFQKITRLKLGDKKAKQYAKQLLAQPQPESLLVRATCMELLKGAAEPTALQLMEDARKQRGNAQPFKAAINALGPKGVEYADEALQDETLPLNWRAFCVSKGGKGAEAYALKVLRQENTDHITPDLLAACITKVGADHKNEVAEILRTNRHPSVVSVCLKLLQRDAKAEAQKLLSEGNMPDDIVIQCLNLLGPEAAQHAKQLLTQKGLSNDLRYKCIRLLGDKDQAHSYALERLRNWRECDNWTLAWCLRNAGDADEVKEIVQVMSPQWYQLAPPLKVEILRADDNRPRQQQRAKQVIKLWRQQPRPLVAAAVAVLGKKPESSIDICRQILVHWSKEVARGKTKTSPQYDGHIIKALAHPRLRSLAKKTAKQMFQVENDRPGTLSELLCTRVKDITDSDTYPAWSVEPPIEN